MDLAAAQCVVGAFLHGGQICMSTERILVHASVREAFEAKLATAAADIFPDSKRAPVLITEHAVNKNKALVRDAISKGARLVHGDAEAAQQVPTALRPIIVSGVKPGMDIYLAESFGPTVSVIETGAVHINRTTVHDDSGLPHGGAKASGFGRFNAGFDEWTRLKNITYDL
ncbi:benzaldehyde dehydrogenase (NAD) [Microdochium nivale]|nr:benzaldehyde dehydrogenase (NAD) [Microdochium nivale]